MTFQAMFAIITVALITGAVVERMKFSALIVFAILWFTIVYCPVAHWVWGSGDWLAKLGVLDFAGGTVVHITAGIFASVAVNASGADGLIFGNAMQLAKQLLAVVVVWVFVFATTWVLGKIVDITMGLRVSATEETVGLDISQHGERACGGMLR